MWEAPEYRHDWPTAEEDPRSDISGSNIRKAGRTGTDLDAAQLLLLELALIMFPAAFPQVTRFATGMSPTDPESSPPELSSCDTSTND